jgi:Asp-tRNA(Asn)/Glu-tRNA(Gln) amidotransferase A subunit family amidase
MIRLPRKTEILLFLCFISVWLPVVAQKPVAKRAFDPVETTIAETHAALRSGRISCHALVEIYLKRIRVYDQPTRLNSVVLLNPEALADADRLDREFARTHQLRPLHCIVMAVKDNYDTKGLQTTAGSLALKGFIPTEDAFMVKKIREAGAIILFKSNMAEWAFSPVVTESSIAGITRNPYDLNRVPAGSSGGTAASVAANLAEVGLGSDTGDSIRGPSSHNDLVGIRPTIGLTSRDGIVPLNSKADVGGPLARTVADAAAVLSVVAGVDPADPVTAQARGKIEKDYTRFLDPKGLRGARLGVFRRYIDAPTTDPQIKRLMQSAIAEMRAQGAEVVDFDIPDFDNISRRVSCGDFQADLNQYFAIHGSNAPYKSLQAVYDSGLYLPSVGDRIKRALDPEASARNNPNARTGPCLDTYHDQRKIAFRNAITAAMDAAKIDAILYPTWSNPPRLVGDLKSPGGDNSQQLAPPTGMPAITVPIGFTHGMLPAGISMLGRSFSEPTLFRLAYAYEQATKHRKAPPLFGPLP